MKKLFLLIAFTVLCLGLLVSCGECEHVYDNGCDAYCNECGESRKPQHSYENACSEACSLCFEPREITHVYDNACDSECNTDGCEQTRETEHVFSNTCGTDTCEECGLEVVTDHQYSNACDEECNVCGNIRAIEHSYSNSCDDECNVCHAPRIAGHTYDSVCDTDCNVCGGTRTVSHVYDNACDADCNTAGCGATRTPGEHEYDSVCDTDCNVCGGTRTVSHVYDNACDTECNTAGCGATRVTEHTDTTPKDNLCDSCGANLTCPHEYDSVCDTDCNLCGDTRTVSHVYDNACDADCNTAGCGATRTPGEHEYDSVCDTDCNVCGDTRTVSHVYDNACDADCNTAGCGATRVTEHTDTTPKDNLCDSCGATLAEESDDEKETFNKMQSVLLLGQSNMAGRGVLANVEQITDERIYMMRNLGWVPMVEPIHNDKAVAAAGLAASFAKAFVETYDCELGLIPAAVGGTSLADWAVGGDLYNAALEMAKAAQESSDICAILWHQGESDMGNTKYAEQFIAIINAFIEELGLDKDKIVIITGEIGEFRGTNGDRVNAALASITEYERYGCADASGLTAEADGKHYDAASLRVFGYRYFDIFYGAVSGKSYDFDDNPDSYRITPEISNEGYLSREDFENDSEGVHSGSVGNDAFINSKEGEYTVESENGNKYLSMDHIGDTNQPYVDIPFSENLSDCVFVVEGRFRLGKDSLSNGELIKFTDVSNDSNKTVRLIYLKEGGELYSMLGSKTDKALGVSLSEDSWTTVKVICNLKSNTKDIYVNGRAVLLGAALHTEDTSDYMLNKARIMQYKTSKAGSVHFDDYAVYLTKDYVANNNFDSLETDKVYTGSQTTEGNLTINPKDTSVTVIEAPEGGNYLGVEPKGAYVEVKCEPEVASKFVIELRVLISEGFTAGGDLIKLIDSSSSTITLLHVGEGGELYNMSYVNGAAKVGESLGEKLYYEEWTTIKIVCDTVNNTKEIYINGNKIEGSFTLKDSDTSSYATKKIRLIQYKLDGEGYLYLDDFACYYA